MVNDNKPQKKRNFSYKKKKNKSAVKNEPVKFEKKWNNDAPQKSNNYSAKSRNISRNNRNKNINNKNSNSNTNNIKYNDLPEIIKFEEKELTVQYAKNLKNLIENNVKNGTNKFVFDFEKIEMISSAGFAFLLYSLRRSHQVGGEVKFCNVPEPVYDLLEVVHLTLTFEVFPSSKEALKSFEEKTEINFRKEKKMRIKALLKQSYLEDSTEPIY
jgi:anti-anti-sigma factor